MRILEEEEMLGILSGAKNILLLRPEPIRANTRIPLALAKISAFCSSANRVFSNVAIPGEWDLVCVSSVFMFNTTRVVAEIGRMKFLSLAPVIVGGVPLSLDRDAFEGADYGFAGYSRELDNITPDYSLDWGVHSEYSETFTSRGCVRKCPYCVVPRVEGGVNVVDNWRGIIPDGMIARISDNNLCGAHCIDVLEHLIERDLRVVFDNGFDCRQLTPEIIRLLSRVKLGKCGIRLSFDRISDDGIFQSVIKSMLSCGISRHNIMAYCLFNFTDTPEEADYRLTVCRSLGIRGYPTRYMRLKGRTRDGCRYVGMHWSEELLQSFRHFWMLRGLYSKQDFLDYVKNQGGHCQASSG